MSYANAIRDIATGSLWECGHPRQLVRVTGAAATVVTVSDGKASQTFIEAEFRARFQPLYDRQQVRQQFTMSLANLTAFGVYWSPHHKRILIRSTECSRKFRVPVGSIFIGVYQKPMECDEFFRDLNYEILQRSTRQEGESLAEA